MVHGLGLVMYLINYIDIFKSVLKLFTDFFTGKWGNLGKDIQKIWNALWGFVESIFGKKVDSIKKVSKVSVLRFGIHSTQLKLKSSDFWKGMWVWFNPIRKRWYQFSYRCHKQWYRRN